MNVVPADARSAEILRARLMRRPENRAQVTGANCIVRISVIGDPVDFWLGDGDEPVREKSAARRMDGAAAREYVAILNGEPGDFTAQMKAALVIV